MEETTFQFHVTTAALSPEQKGDYPALCQQLGVKPVLISLPKGAHINQPMFTALVTALDLDAAMAQVKGTIQDFADRGFPAMRVKAEVSAQDAPRFLTSATSSFTPYYEWHCKIESSQPDAIAGLAEQYGAHLSENTLEADQDLRFLTIRAYEDEAGFYQRAEEISQVLLQAGVPIVKQKFEYCIFDSSMELDRGWTWE